MVIISPKNIYSGVTPRKAAGIAVCICSAILVVIWTVSPYILDTYFNTYQIRDISSGAPQQNNDIINGKFVVFSGTVIRYDQHAPLLTYQSLIINAHASESGFTNRVPNTSFILQDETGTLVAYQDPDLNCLPRIGSRVKVAGYFLETISVIGYGGQFYAKQIIGGCE